MKSPVVCNYSVIRFLPYPESGEFVNIGVVVHSPQTGFFDFRIEKRRFQRIRNFFPELAPKVFRESILVCFDELNRIKSVIGINDEDPRFMFPEADLGTALFRELVRPRESIVRYSKPGTVQTPKLTQLLNDLFEHYVQRMFAREDEYQEEIMRKRVLMTLKTHRLLERFKQGYRVGNDEYGFRMPFATESRAGIVDKAIKPLNLAQSDSTKIYDHGAVWVNRMKHLRKLEAAPREMLFIVNEPPKESRRRGAYVEVCRELEGKGTTIIPATEEAAIVEFASRDYIPKAG